MRNYYMVREQSARYSAWSTTRAGERRCGRRRSAPRRSARLRRKSTRREENDRKRWELGEPGAYGEVGESEHPHRMMRCARVLASAYEVAKSKTRELGRFLQAARGALPPEAIAQPAPHAMRRLRWAWRWARNAAHTYCGMNAGATPEGRRPALQENKAAVALSDRKYSGR